jgi:hypothetical protein
LFDIWREMRGDEHTLPIITPASGKKVRTEGQRGAVDRARMRAMGMMEAVDGAMWREGEVKAKNGKRRGEDGRNVQSGLTEVIGDGWGRCRAGAASVHGPAGEQFEQDEKEKDRSVEAQEDGKRGGLLLERHHTNKSHRWRAFHNSADTID